MAISPHVEKFFRQKSFLRSQQILEILPNGWIKISYSITSDDILLMLARRWFPDMIILGPKAAKDKFDTLVEQFENNKQLFE